MSSHLGITPSDDVIQCNQHPSQPPVILPGQQVDYEGSLVLLMDRIT